MSCLDKEQSDVKWASEFSWNGIGSLDFDTLQNSIQNPADIAWFLTKYINSFGSQYLPEQVLTSIGLHPNGCGTYMGSFGTGLSSEFAVYGSFSKMPEKYSLVGTVAVTKASFSVYSPAWSKKIHMDYNFQDPSHSEAHMHWGTSGDKYDLNTQAEEALIYIGKGLSPEFKNYLWDLKKSQI